MTFKVRDKILIISGITLLMAIGANTFVVSRMFRSEYSSALLSKMNVIANTIKSQIERLTALGIAANNIEGFEAQCQEAIRKHKDIAYAMIVQKNGRIIFHNNPELQGTTIKSSVILKALKQDRQTVCLSNTTGQTYYNTIVPISDGSNESNAAVIVGFPTTLIDRKIYELHKYSYMVAATSLGIATLLLLASLSISVTKPLSNLVTTIQQIRESSDLSSKVTIKSQDEIGKLALNFNMMIEDLKRTTVSRDALIKEVTERKKVEEALRKSDERFKQVAENAGDWIWEVNAEGLYTYSNSMVEHILGYKPQEIVGKTHFYDFFAPNVKEELKNAALKAFARGENFKDFTNTNIHKDGSMVIIETNGTPVIDNLGNICGYRGIDRDVTARKKSEQSMEKLNEKLLQSNQQLQEFTYVASHDLREPIRKISLFGEMLAASIADKLSDDDKENLNYMINGAERMQQMIEALLVYSRVSTKGVSSQKIDLNKIIKQLIDLELSVMLEETKGSVSVPEPLPQVFVDPTQIRQLLQNLIANALKYHQKNTTPEVTVQARTEDNDMIRVEVKDNGIGIKKEQLKNAFVMFRRLNPSSEYEGTGIGLAVCKRIVERHGGQIGIESTFGEGSTFWFTIPAADRAVTRETEQFTAITAG